MEWIGKEGNASTNLGEFRCHLLRPVYTGNTRWHLSVRLCTNGAEVPFRTQVLVAADFPQARAQAEALLVSWLADLIKEVVC